MEENKEKIIIEVEGQDIQDESAQIGVKNLRVLVFSLGGENYCVEIKQVKEAVRMAQITEVPNTPEFIVGAMNLRGDIIAIIDIKQFFGLEAKEQTDLSRVIVTDILKSPVGILVDRVQNILDIDEKDIQPPLSTLKAEVVQYTRGQVNFEDKIIVFLDFEKILNCQEIKTLRTGGVQ
ncbi:MAG: chemotaxis protein CheW [Candidatus Omnitrophica bacterium]|nr:chemotaxis protein CheW [Candidatus Omnitrophota bacterium]